MSLLLLLLAQAPDAFAARSWAQFSRAGALSLRAETVDIATAGRVAGKLRYKLRLTRGRGSAAQTAAWTDSRACPAVGQVLAGMEALRVPRLDAPGIGEDSTDIVLDGTEYLLTTPWTDSNGRLVLRSNIGSPLAASVDASLSALAPCWSTAVPSYAG